MIIFTFFEISSEYFVVAQDDITNKDVNKEDFKSTDAFIIII